MKDVNIIDRNKAALVYNNMLSLGLKDLDSIDPDTIIRIYNTLARHELTHPYLTLLYARHKTNSPRYKNQIGKHEIALVNLYKKLEFGL